MKRVACLIIGCLIFTHVAYAQVPPPALEFCPGTVSGFFDETIGEFRPFNCDDLDTLYLEQGASYQLDQNGNLVSGSITPPKADYEFINLTGFAEFVNDGCEVIDVSSTDSLNLVPDDGQNEIITRTFMARCGDIASPDVCTQAILIEDCPPPEPEPAAIPTLSQWGMIFLTLSVLGLAVFRRKTKL